MNGLNADVEFVQLKVDGKTLKQTSEGYEYTYPDPTSPDGVRTVTIPESDTTISTDGVVTLPFVKSVKFKDVKAPDLGGIGGSKGGGSKKKAREVKRYHTVDKQLESLNKKLDSASNKKNRAFSEE